MDHADSSLNVKSDPHLKALAERAFRVGQQVEHVRRQARAAQQAAAVSFEKSADSHDRAGRSYEELAKHSELGRTEYRARSVRHHDFAQEDRLIAERLRRMAEEL